MQIANQIYTSIPSYEKKRLGGKKKVNAFKDGFNFDRNVKIIYLF